MSALDRRTRFFGSSLSWRQFALRFGVFLLGVYAVVHGSRVIGDVLPSLGKFTAVTLRDVRLLLEALLVEAPVFSTFLFALAGIVAYRDERLLESCLLPTGVLLAVFAGLIQVPLVLIDEWHVLVGYLAYPVLHAVPLGLSFGIAGFLAGVGIKRLGF